MRLRILVDNRTDGLSLIELVVAVGILAVVAVAGFSVLLQAEKTNNASRAKTMAINAAQEQLEAIFKDAPSNVLSYNNVTFAVGDMVRPSGGNPGLITVTGAEPYLITVSVSWQGQGTLPSGQTVFRALRTTVAR